MKIRNKVMFLSAVTSVMVVVMIAIVTSSCSHGSSGHDYVFDPAEVYGESNATSSLDTTKPIEEGSYDGEQEHYCYDGFSVVEAIEVLNSLTGECSCQDCDENCDGIVKIRVKDNTEADRRALADTLRSLKEEVKVYLDLHYTYVDAGSYAFANCKSLEGVVLAAHQEDLGGSSFSECINLKEVYCPENLKTIGERAFYDCESLTTLTLPKTLETMGRYAFCYCYALEEIDLSKTQLKEIPERAFWMDSYSSSTTSALTTVYLPETIESIGERAFYYCQNLTTLTKDEGNKLSQSLKTMGSYAFSYCYALATIDLSETQLKEIPNYAFYMSSSSLTKVYLPETLETIGNSAFGWCRNLTTLTKDGNNKLPQSLKTMGSSAFDCCFSLEIIDLSETQLKEISYRAFAICESLTTLTEDGSNKLPQSLKTMGNYAFYCCTSLETIDLSETQLKEIPDSAFYMNSTTTSVLATVYLPDTIESIGCEAFRDCSSLTTLTIEKEEGKAWGHPSNTYSSESNPSVETLTMIPCFEENAAYFLAGNGELQCTDECCKDGDTCCGDEECVCEELTDGYSYWWYKVAYPE